MADILGIGAIASAAVEGGKAIYGASQAKKGEKQMMSALDAIKYSRPEEYEQIMNLLGQRVSGVTTRREAAEERVRATTASSIPGISQLADSPVAGLTAFSGLKQREQQAIADLGIQYEGIRDQAIMGQVSGLQMGAGYSEKEAYYNDMYKQMVRANIGASKMGAGTSMMWGGIEGMAGTAMDYAGTKYLGDIYAGGNNTYGAPGGGGYQYSPNFTSSIGAMGQGQVDPATGLGTDPYKQ